MSLSYQKIKELGSGLHGKVHLIGSEDRETKLVLKELKDPEYRTYAKNECEVLGFLKKYCSQYVVCLHHCSEDASEIFLEYLDNYIDLFDFIIMPAYANVTFPLVYEIARNLIDGLIYLHSLGVAVNDIKPENVLVNPKTGKIKYIDFGLACLKDKCTLERIGTPNYMAPETFERRFSGSAASSFEKLKQADIWSLGQTIFTLVARAILVDTPEFKSYLQSYIRNKRTNLEVTDVVFIWQWEIDQLLTRFLNGKFPAKSFATGPRVSKFQKDYPEQYAILMSAVEGMLNYFPSVRKLSPLPPFDPLESFFSSFSPFSSSSSSSSSSLSSSPSSPSPSTHGEKGEERKERKERKVSFLDQISDRLVCEGLMIM